MSPKIILASSSLWRKRLLKKRGIICTVHLSNFKELKKQHSPRALVLYNASGKAHTVAQEYKKGIIVGVDTVGVLGKKILGKPKSRSDAKRMLMMLSGKTHRIISGLCVVNVKNNKEAKTATTTKITFKKIEPEELQRYLDCGHWKGKAGSYAIQGRAKGFVKKIQGDIENVVGIPTRVLKKMLSKVR